MAQSDMYHTGFEDFRRYFHGEMTTQEQHRFEKRMLEEPFFADAYEGYISLLDDRVDHPSSVKELRDRLEIRLNSEKKRLIPIWSYGVAASLLLGLSWLGYHNLWRPEKMNSAVSESKLPRSSEPKAMSVNPLASVTTTSPDSSAFEDRNALISSSPVKKKTIAPPLGSKAALIASQDKKDVDEHVEAFQESAAESLAGNQQQPAQVQDKTILAAPSATFSPAKGIALAGKNVSFTNVAQGRVIDANGKGLPGVNIYKSKKQVVATDVDGNFKIDIPILDSLRIAYIGYKDKWITAVSRDLGNITLEEDSKMLNEVVVIGYGVSQKKSLSVPATRSIKATPVGGWDAYQNYLHLKDGKKRRTVRVSFKVNANGVLSDFTAEGPESLKDTAIKHIQNGPSWLPGTTSETALPETVVVIVNFVR
jgi:hypothetical protein